MYVSTVTATADGSGRIKVRIPKKDTHKFELGKKYLIYAYPVDETKPVESGDDLREYTEAMRDIYGN